MRKNALNYYLTQAYACSDDAGEKLRKIFRSPDGARVYEVFLKTWNPEPGHDVMNQWTANELKEEAGIGEATVFRMLNILEEAGVIEAVGREPKQRNVGGPRSRLWTLKGMKTEK